MSVQMCYKIKDNIKISKNQLSTTFSMAVTVFVRSIQFGCFELLSYIHIHHYLTQFMKILQVNSNILT